MQTRSVSRITLFDEVESTAFDGPPASASRLLYQGPQFRQALAKILPRLPVEIVKRSDTAKGFKVLPRRWVVQRTFAWLNRCRRLAKDFENLNRNALAFIKLASITLMLRKLSNSR